MNTWTRPCRRGGLAIAVVLAFSASAGRAQSLPFTTYSSDDGLVQSVVLAAVQDSAGYLWFGTPDGLSRFDGLEFTHFEESDGLPGRVVRALLEDSGGTLWVGTDSGLARFVDGVWEAAYAEKITHPIRDLAEDGEGGLWIATYGGGALHVGESGTRIFTTAEGLAHDKARAVLRDRQDRVWLGTYGGGVSLYEQGSWRGWATDDGLGDLFVRALVEDREGRLLAGTNRGVYLLRGPSFVAYEPAAELRETAVTVLMEDRAGRLWVGTRDRGACRLSDGALACYSLEQGLADNSINDIVQDREGNLWFATFGGGASRLTNESFVNYTPRSGLPYGSVQAFTQSGREIWIGTHGGGMGRLSGGRFDLLTTRDGLPHDKVLTAWADPEGGVWLGTLAGVARFRKGRFATFAALEALAVVYDVAAEQDGTLWFATLDGAYAMAGDGSVTAYKMADGLAGMRVNCVIPARRGGVWLGTDGGLTHFRDGRLKNFTEAHGLADDFVHALLEAGDETLFIATADGLSVLSAGEIETFDTVDGLSRDTCTALLEGDDGRIWIGTTRGIYVYDGERFVVYTARDGLPSSEVNPGAAFKDTRGRLWFGTVRGATVFEPDASPPEVAAPPVHVTRLEVAGRQLAVPPESAKLRLAHGHNDLRIGYVGVSLAYPEEVSYQYRLEGVDERWRLTSSRTVDFPALAPGSYVFAVRASHGGSWSEPPARLAFEIAPPFWQTWWFRALTVMALGLLALAGHRVRVRHMRRQKLQLQREVRERTSEIRRINSELRELDEKKNEFLGIAAHDLRSPLGSVLSTTELLLRLIDEDRMDKPLWRRFLGNVRTTAAEMRTLVEDLLDVAAIETGRIELRLARERMADVLEEREAFQIRTAREKQIELTIEKDTTDLEVLADRVRLGEVVDNLMTNAVKYTRPGGRVRVYCESQNGEVITHVEDTGLGFEPAEVDKVFTGQKLSPRPTAGEPSTGLGLVIVKKLVELHGGRIWVVSEKDRGSTFSFSLPRALPEESQ